MISADVAADLVAHAEHVVVPDVQARFGGAGLFDKDGAGEEAGRCDGDMVRFVR